MKGKIIIKEPVLEIVSNEDGAWLRFKASNVCYADLNIALLKP